jgi:DNA-binding NtrC family response regulator
VAHLIARGPDGGVEHTLEIEAPSALLIGRAPDPEAARAAHDVEDRHFRRVAIDAPSVSANHALVWSEEGTVCVRDLQSRNGTWMLLPRGQTVRVGTGDVVLQLARSSQEGGEDEPAAPLWNGRQDFAVSVAVALQQWLRKRGIDAHVAVVPAPAQLDHPATRVSLATGEALDLVPLATADASWSRLVERLWAWVERHNTAYDAEEETRREGLILASRAIRSAHREVVEAAQGGARTLLLTGASGAGKEVLAEVFHRYSGRSGAFVPVNCSMFSRELLRSELFGAEVGSFTGATRRIVGAVERAQGGTLFLDEIGEVPIDVQPMLLRFLDRREFEHVGQYGRTQRADVRVVAATNRDLRESARTGGFRVDLWYRLSVHVVEIPPLRQRWEDVLGYLESVPPERGQHSIREALSAEALELLREHRWDGNFRELTNFVQRLPRNPAPGSIDRETCFRALERGSLRFPVSAPVQHGQEPPSDWTAVVARAISAFVEDHGNEPRSWDDQKEWNEKYLKPLLFFHLSGATSFPRPADESALTSLASQIAGRVHADRGTAAKQLARYFERFGR